MTAKEKADLRRSKAEFAKVERKFPGEWILAKDGEDDEFGGGKGVMKDRRGRIVSRVVYGATSIVFLDI